MKIILILLDGLGDRCYPELNDRTPLQAAETPNLDRLAAAGSNGLFHASFPGQCLPSEIAHFLLFGYDLADFPGRGLLEAVGENISFQKEDSLCLAHLCGIEWQDGIAVLKSGRDDITGTREEIARIYALIDRFEMDNIRIRLEHTRRNDAILVLSGAASHRISDSDPIRKGLPIARIEAHSDALTENAQRTAAVLNTYLRYCHEILNDPARNPYLDEIPANFLVTQRCGMHRPQTGFEDLWGLRGALIASPSVYAGLAREIGLDFIQAVDTPSPGDDLHARIEQAVADNDHNFLHVHTKIPDEAAHKGDPKYKRDVISLLDRGLGQLAEAMPHRDDILLAVTADHSTPSGTPLIHSGEPVPLLIYGANVRRDNVEKFNEIEAATGCLGMLRGAEMMAMLLNYSNRSVLCSHRLGTLEHHFFPPSYKPFRQK
jgi:2,3-bisphosphoglycerate-independent phosphoglycerate mutase